MRSTATPATNIFCISRVEVTYTSTPDTLKTFLSFLISNAVKWSTDGISFILDEVMFF